MRRSEKQAVRKDEEAKVSLGLYIWNLTLGKGMVLFPSIWKKNGATNNHSNKGSALDLLNMVISSVLHKLFEVCDDWTPEEAELVCSFNGYWKIFVGAFHYATVRQRNLFVYVSRVARSAVNILV